jgi:hypothetical protein
MNKSKMPMNTANLATSASSASDAVLRYHHLTKEEKDRLQVVATSDDSQVVFYRPKRKVKKKRGAIDNSDLAPSLPRETGELKKKYLDAAAIDNNRGDVETAANIRREREQTSVNVRRQERNIRNDREQTSVNVRREERNIRKDREQPSANAPPHQGRDMRNDREQPSADAPHEHSGRNADWPNMSTESITATASRMGYCTRSAIHCMTRYKAIKIAQVLLAMYVGILTFADIGPPGGLRDTETGLIIDQASPERTARGLILINGTERAIVGATYFQVVCVGITRMR